MILPLQSFTTMLENMSAGLQGRAVQLVDLSVGSVLRALLEACASIALWMQWLILQVLSMTRAATSSGIDLDSWMADFSFVRLPGAYSGGLVTFSRFTPGLSTTIPQATSVLTTDRTLSFSVIGDLANASWDEASLSYVVPPNAASITIPVQAINPGAAGNILAGTIGLLGSAISGIDEVTNASAFSGGVDAESDVAFRARFPLYINSRSLGTATAVGAAISSLQQGVRYTVIENVNLQGSAAPGNFCVVVDDGSSTASTTFLAAVSAAIDVVRPIGTTFSVTAASILQVTVEMTVLTSMPSMTPTIALAVQQAILSWVATLPMGGLLSISKLEALAHNASGAIVSIPSMLVNGVSSDISASPGTVFRAVSVNVSSS